MLAWSATLSDVKNPHPVSFSSGFGQVDLADVLWFEDRDQGVVVSRVQDAGRSTLYGVDVSSGALVWQRDLPYGDNDCRRLSQQRLFCINQPAGQRHTFSEITVLQGRDGATLDAWTFSANDYLTVQASSEHLFVLQLVGGSDAESPQVELLRLSSGAVPDWSQRFDLPADWDQPRSIWLDVSEPERTARIGYSGSDTELAVDITHPHRPTLAKRIRRWKSPPTTTQLSAYWWLQSRYSDALDAEVSTLLGKAGQRIPLGAGLPWARFTPGTPVGPEGSWFGFGLRLVHLPTGHVTRLRCSAAEKNAQPTWAPSRNELVMFGDHRTTTCPLSGGPSRTVDSRDGAGERDSVVLEFGVGRHYVATASSSGIITVRDTQLNIVGTVRVGDGYQYSQLTPTPLGFVLLNKGEMQGYVTDGSQGAADRVHSPLSFWK
jgi:hypothetical protein